MAKEAMTNTFVQLRRLNDTIAELGVNYHVDPSQFWEVKDDGVYTEVGLEELVTLRKLCDDMIAEMQKPMASAPAVQPTQPTPDSARGEVTIFTDGSCKGNGSVGARGGWAAVLQFGQHTKQLSGSEEGTTNNRMELTACIQGLNALKHSCNVVLYTDSSYVKDGINSWIAGWKARGWKTAAKKPVQNQDLWMALDEAVSRHNVTWQWVKGHAGHEGNELADTLAQQAADRAPMAANA